MEKETPNFIIKSDIPLSYFDEIVNNVKTNENEILKFLNLTKLQEKYTIELLSYPAFKQEIVNIYGEIKPYMRGHTSSNQKRIGILNLDDECKYTTHKNATLPNMEQMIIHEVVHACQNEYHQFARESIWFHEGLATNLSHQDYQAIDLQECDFNLLQHDWLHCLNNYNYAYTIVKYMLENYSHEKMMEYITDVNSLKNDANAIFNDCLQQNMNQFHLK